MKFNMIRTSPFKVIRKIRLFFLSALCLEKFRSLVSGAPTFRCVCAVQSNLSNRRGAEKTEARNKKGIFGAIFLPTLKGLVLMI